MLRKKALRKIFITTLSMLIILTIYTIPTTIKDNVLRTNLEIEDITNLKTDKIYLINKNNYLVKTDIFIDSNKLEEKIKKIIDYLIIDNNKIPDNLNGYIPKNTKLIDFNIESNSIVLNFSKELTKSTNEEIMITGIVYSLLELNEIKEVSFQIENNFYKNYTNLNKDIGINKNILYTSRKDVNRIVTYYLDDTDNYYVPVTNYLNINKDKIEMIIENLKEIKPNLISYISEKTELLDYKEENNLLILNFSKELKNENTIVEDKILNTISYSVFDNFDVNMVMFQIEGKTYKYIKR